MIRTQNKVSISLGLVFLTLISLSSLFVSGCGLVTENGLLGNMALSSPEQSPEDHRVLASNYIRMANEGNPSQSLEYRLRAADELMKAKQFPMASRVLREIQAQETNLDPALQSQILEARLSLLKDDHHRAQTLVGSLLVPYNANRNLQGTGSQFGFAGNPGQKIALLLPSKGPHAEAAKTIRDGFLAAYYKTLEHRPTDPTVQVYDTGEGANVEAAYRKAVADHADFVVGPLTKTEVQTIAGLQLDVPVLALNSIQAKKQPNKLYQFGLMPEDEVLATVENASRRGHRRAVVIAPNNDWGNRMVSAFQQSWTNHGGSIARVIILNQNQNMESQLRAAVIRADMIFLAAGPELARQVKPLLSYLSSDVPVYATSSVYTGSPSPKLDQDLDGIHFCDMPWVIHNSYELQEVKAKFAELGPNNSARSPRYFAMGMDAYTLANQLAATRFLPASGTRGMTGELRIDGQKIQRKLVCVKFEHGVPVSD